MHSNIYYIALILALLAIVSLYIYLVVVFNLILCQQGVNRGHESALVINARRRLRQLIGSYLYDRLYSVNHNHDDNNDASIWSFLFRRNRIEAFPSTNAENDIEASFDSYVSMDTATECSDESKEEIRQPLTL